MMYFGRKLKNYQYAFDRQNLYGIDYGRHETETISLDLQLLNGSCHVTYTKYTTTTTTTSTTTTTIECPILFATFIIVMVTKVANKMGYYSS